MEFVQRVALLEGEVFLQSREPVLYFISVRVLIAAHSKENLAQDRRADPTLNAGNSINCSLSNPSTSLTVTFEFGKVNVDIFLREGVNEGRSCLMRWVRLSIGLST